MRTAMIGAATLALVALIVSVVFFDVAGRRKWGNQTGSEQELPPAPEPESPPPPEPTPEQLASAKEAFVKRGAWECCVLVDQVSKRRIPHFFPRNGSVFALDLKDLPDLPFGFGLASGDPRNVQENGDSHSAANVDPALYRATLQYNLQQASLKELALHKNLTSLYLEETNMTDAGLKELAPHKNLTTLHLNRTDITDAGLKELAALKNLTTLNLTHTQVTNAGLKHLAPLKNLTTLYLGGMFTKVTGEGLKELAPLTKLTTLWMYGAEASRLRYYREANLLHAFPGAQAADGKRPATAEDVTTLTGVSEADFKELGPLKNLTTLIMNQRVSDNGVMELQKIRPKCKIAH
jgi:hypothetical protein